MANKTEDSLSTLCNLMASMGASKVATVDIIKHCKSKDKALPSTNAVTPKVDSIVAPKSALSAAQNSETVASDLNLEKREQTNSTNGNTNVLNNAGELSATDLAAERKARKEAKKAKKVGPKGAGTGEAPVSTASDDKENTPVPVATLKQDADDQQDKSKADLKRERRALQEAQRAAKATASVVDAASTMQQSSGVEPAKETTKKAVTKQQLMTGGRRVKSRVKGGSVLPLVGYLRDPDYFIEEPSYYKHVHPEFERVTQEIYLGSLSNNDSQCVSFLHCLYCFLSQYWAEPNTDIERDISNKLEPNISYMKEYNGFTPPMENLMRLFREMLRKTIPTFTAAVAKAKAAGSKQAITTTPVKDRSNRRSSGSTTAKADCSLSSDVSMDADASNEEAVTRTSDDWSLALRDMIVTLREWILNFLRKTYQQPHTAMMKRVANFLDDGDILLVHGYSKLVANAIEEACSDGRSLSVVVVDRIPNGESVLMLRQLRKVNLNGGYVRKALLSDLASLIHMVQKVLVPCNHVLLAGSTQGPAGYAVIVAMAAKINLPVLGICYSYQYTDIDLPQVFKDNHLCPPEDYLWGRQPLTKIGTPNQLCSAGDSTEPSSNDRTTLSLTTNPSYTLLSHTITDRLLNGTTNSSVTTNGSVPVRGQLSSNPLRSAQAKLSGASYSVCGSNADYYQPYMTANVSCCCLKFDLAPTTIAYTLTELYTMQPACAPSVMAKFNKLL